MAFGNDVSSGCVGRMIGAEDRGSEAMFSHGLEGLLHLLAV